MKPKAKRGRPPLPKNLRKIGFTVKLRPDVLRFLQERADVAHMSRAEYLTELLSGHNLALRSFIKPS